MRALVLVALPRPGTCRALVLVRFGG